MWRKLISLTLVLSAPAIAQTSVPAQTAIAQKSPTAKTKPASGPIATYDVKFEADPKLEIPFEEDAHTVIFSEGCDAD